jgi:hypothetical protein
MDLFTRVEQLLLPLRAAFRRERTFQWFFLLVHGMLLRSRFHGVSSCIEALGLGAAAYHQALHFFRSTAVSTRDLMKAWNDALLPHPDVLRFGDRPVYVGDGIKIPKEGRRMPGVKRLHQESENNSKPTWIRGHYFGALGLLFKRGRACFNLPIYTQLQDGLDATGQPDDDDSLVDKMGRLARDFLPPGAYLILDAYYAAKDLLTTLTAARIDLITRVKVSTVAYRPLPPPPEKRGRGRPRKWGERVKLKELFEETEAFEQRRLWLYQALQGVRWRVVDLYWHSPTTPVRFVLAELDNGKRLILLSTDCMPERADHPVGVHLPVQDRGGVLGACGSVVGVRLPVLEQVACAPASLDGQPGPERDLGGGSFGVVEQGGELRAVHQPPGHRAGAVAGAEPGSLAPGVGPVPGMVPHPPCPRSGQRIHGADDPPAPGDSHFRGNASPSTSLEIPGSPHGAAQTSEPPEREGGRIALPLRRQPSPETTHTHIRGEGWRTSHCRVMKIWGFQI